MMTVKDPWVLAYERLHEILNLAGVSEYLEPNQKRKIFFNHRGAVTKSEWQEALELFEHVYPKG